MIIITSFLKKKNSKSQIYMDLDLVSKIYVSKLLTKGIPCEEFYVYCDLLAETQTHVFFVCFKAAIC